jgi:hypothetical protein
MEYNTQRNKLIIPEYGRHVQKMIEYACSIEDRDERNTVAQAIVGVMGTLNPQLRDVADFKHKLWDHLFIIADFKLDVDAPYDRPDVKSVKFKPKKVEYPKHKIKYKYYGKTLEDTISLVGKLEEGESKDALVQALANFMKLQYLTWNKDAVEDGVIFAHLREMSGGDIKVRDDIRLSQHFVFTTRNAGLTRGQKKQYKKKRIKK